MNLSDSIQWHSLKQLIVLLRARLATALIGLVALEKALGNVPGPITIGACDNGALYDANAFGKLVENPNVDVIVWGVRGFPQCGTSPENVRLDRCDGGNNQFDFRQDTAR